MFATSTTVAAHAVGVFLRLSIVPVRTKTSPNGFTLYLRCPSAARPAKTSDCATTSVSPPTKLYRFERVLDGFTANLILTLNLIQSVPSASSSSLAFESSSACASRARTPWTCAKEKLNNKLLQPDKRSINVHHDEALKAAPNSGHILKYLGISHHFPLGIHVSTKQREWHQEEQEPTQEKRYP